MNKKYLRAFVFCFIFLFANFLHAQALSFSSYKPFGGRVISTQTPSVACTSQYGALQVKSVNQTYGAGPYFIRSTTRPVRVGGWILGFYIPTKDSTTCVNDATGAPIPANEIVGNPLGTSK